MRAIDAERRLCELLAEREIPMRGKSGRGEDARLAWEAFCAAALEPAHEPFTEHDPGESDYTRWVDEDCDSDLLLHESSVDDQGRFVLHFTRQFTFVDSDEEYGGMNGLSLAITFEGEGDVLSARAQRWGYAGPHEPDVDEETHPEIDNWAGHVPAWAAEVESSKSFKAFDQMRPVSFTVDQSDI